MIRGSRFLTEELSLSGELKQLSAAHSNLGIRLGGKEELGRFRAKERGLVSCLDDMERNESTREGVVVCSWKGEDLGVSSFVVQKNSHKQKPKDHFGRVDLVVVHNDHRGFGISKLLVYSTVLQILVDRGSVLYSISCLAAHGAIEHILEEIGFETKRREELFAHQEFSFENAHWLDFKGKLVELVTAQVGQVVERLAAEEGNE